MGKIAHKILKKHKPVEGTITFNGRYYSGVCKYCYERIALTGNIFSIVDKWVLLDDYIIDNDPDMEG